MATIASNDMTIVDAAKMMGANGEILASAELLHQKNGIVADVEWVEGDTADGHMSAQETSLPTVDTKVANEGVASSKGTDAQITEKSESLEGWSVIDERVADYGGNPAAKIARQTSKFAESLNQKCADRYIYGNGDANPGQINGLARRFNSISSGETKANIVNGGGTGSDNMSIWLIGHGIGKFYGWYPKGSKAGLQIIPFGKVTRTLTSGEQVVWKTQYKWDIGLALDDWRYVARACNLDKSNIMGGTGPDLFQIMTDMTHMIPDLSACRPSFYMNRTLRLALDRQAREDVKAGGMLSYADVGGQFIDTFRKIPITILDRLTEAEAALT